MVCRGPRGVEPESSFDLRGNNVGMGHGKRRIWVKNLTFRGIQKILESRSIRNGAANGYEAKRRRSGPTLKWRGEREHIYKRAGIEQRALLTTTTAENCL